jgi:rare lipoprotein A
VTNLANGKSVEVKINDRGPFTEDRIIDLSQAAAKALEFLQSGNATVRLELLSDP